MKNPLHFTFGIEYSRRVFAILVFQVAAFTALAQSTMRVPGANPMSDLTAFNGKLYGMTSAGGTHNAGVLFEWDPSTNVYVTKINFDGSIGSNPWGSLTLHNGKFYGMTLDGGVNNLGVLFEWDP